MTGLPVSADWKGDSYNSILVIVDRLTKMVHYELVKVTIDAPKLAEVILLRRSSSAPRPTLLNYDWWRLTFYLKILVIALLLSQHQTEALNRILPLDRRSNQEAEQYHRSLPLSLCQLRAKWLGQAYTNGGIHLHQHQECQYQPHAFRVELWLPLLNIIQGRYWPPLPVQVGGQIISRTQGANDGLLRKSPLCSETLKVHLQ